MPTVLWACFQIPDACPRRAWAWHPIKRIHYRQFLNRKTGNVMPNPYEALQSTATRSADEMPPFFSGEIFELQEDVSASPYYNPDVAPTRKADRKWGTWDIAALWVGMCACIPSYQLASGL